MLLSHPGVREAFSRWWRTSSFPMRSGYLPVSYHWQPDQKIRINFVLQPFARMMALPRPGGIPIECWVFRETNKQIFLNQTSAIKTQECGSKLRTLISGRSPAAIGGEVRPNSPRGPECQRGIVYLSPIAMDRELEDKPMVTSGSRQEVDYNSADSTTHVNLSQSTRS